jgi:hypothetical protein
MAAELSQRERARRRRLRQELIRLFVDIEPAALDRLYRMAEAKLVAAKNATDDRYHGCQ